MGPEYVVYYMTRPLGLLCIGIALAIPFVIWRLILGSKFVAVGYAPLLFGYIASLAGLFLMALGTSYTEFTHRVEAGFLEEGLRWTTIFGWSMSFSLLSLLTVLPTLGVLVTPVVGYYVRTKKFTPYFICRVVLLTWIALAIATWTFPSNLWHMTHRLESLQMALTRNALAVSMVGLPFLLAIYLCVELRLRSNGDV